MSLVVIDPFNQIAKTLGMKQNFTGNFTQQEPIPTQGIEAAIAVMQSGRIHRYNVVGDDIGETASLELEFAEYVGSKYCLAVASGGYALATAMRAVGVQAGDAVLTNAFTLAPVPGAIAAVGAKPVFVGVTSSLTIDLQDLAAKISQAKVLLLSHMRGHLCDMDALLELCCAHGVIVIEDCAHTMGAKWNGRMSGTDGLVGCYSTQTYKHINSGEGGLLVTNDPEVMARATMMSGSYMMFGKHPAGPSVDVFDQIRYETPNMSGRMDHLRAAILRPQLADLDRQIARWNDRYRRVEQGISDCTGLTVIKRPQAEFYVGSSIQFLLMDWSASDIQQIVQRCADRGVELKWFGAPEPVGFTSRYDSWKYAPEQSLPDSDPILHAILDMRLPLTFDLDDCDLIADIIRQEVGAVYQSVTS